MRDASDDPNPVMPRGDAEDPLVEIARLSREETLRSGSPTALPRMRQWAGLHGWFLGAVEGGCVSFLLLCDSSRIADASEVLSASALVGIFVGLCLTRNRFNYEQSAFGMTQMECVLLTFVFLALSGLAAQVHLLASPLIVVVGLILSVRFLNRVHWACGEPPLDHRQMLHLFAVCIGGSLCLGTFGLVMSLADLRDIGIGMAAFVGGGAIGRVVVGIARFRTGGGERTEQRSEAAELSAAADPECDVASIDS